MVDTNEFLNYEGLKKYDEKIKEVIENKAAIKFYIWEENDDGTLSGDE